jgi:hypothetical protein
MGPQFDDSAFAFFGVAVLAVVSGCGWLGIALHVAAYVRRGGELARSRPPVRSQAEAAKVAALLEQQRRSRRLFTTRFTIVLAFFLLTTVGALLLALSLHASKDLSQYDPYAVRATRL